MNKAGIYARLSLDADGNGLGIARQVEDGTAKATAMGWQVVDVYRDNSISGSKGLRRPEYERMLADLRSGHINAVVVYDLDRLTRRNIELANFMELHKTLGFGLANVSGDIDLTTASGRMMAVIKGAVAQQEAERTGERVKRQKQQRLAAGKPPTGRWRTFGFTRDFRVVPEEADIVRDAFERVANGESLNSITKRLRAAGVRPVSGGFWHHTATTRMIDSRIYAGRLSYKGNDVGPADIEAIVPMDLYEAANSRRERRPGRVNVRRHLLSGVAICHRCKTPMVGGVQKGRSVYSCNRISGGCGRTVIKGDWLDEPIMENIWQVLAHEYRARDTKTVSDVSGQIKTLNERIALTQGALTSGALDYADGIPMLADLRARKKALAESVDKSETFHKVLTDFKSADVTAQAAEVRRHVTAILVKANPKGSSPKVLNPARFDVVLRSGEIVPGPQFVEEGFGRVVRVTARTREQR